MTVKIAKGLNIIQVRVRLSSGLAEPIGIPRMSITVEDNATVADLKETICESYPELRPGFGVAIPIVSGRHVTFSEPLSKGQEIAFLLPVAGG